MHAARAFLLVICVIGILGLLAGGYGAVIGVFGPAGGPRDILIYLSTPDLDYLVPVTTSLPGNDIETAAAGALVEWVDPEGLLRSPFPLGSTLNSVDVNGSSAVVKVTCPKGADVQEQAFKALLNTLTGTGSVRRVTLEAAGRTWGPSPRPPFINHDGSPPSDAMMRIVLWFGCGEKYLAPITRFVPRTLDPVRTAAEQLVGGPPKGSSLIPPFPPGSRILGVSVKDGVCSVDLSEDVRRKHWGGEAAEMLTIKSLVLTMTEFPDVRAVRVLIGGRAGETLAGHVHLDEAFQRGNINQMSLRPN